MLDIQPPLPAVFIADLHLAPKHPDSKQLFVQFMQTIAPNFQSLFILGDLFDAWIGDDNPCPFAQSIKGIIRHHSQRHHCYLLPGNRDFLLGQTFCQQTGCHYLPQITCINLAHKRIALCHGDQLCSHDQQHQRAHRLMHHPLCKRLAYCLPLSWRARLAQALRQKSQQRNAQLPEATMDATPEAIAHLLHITQAQALIHGHTHRPADHHEQGQPAYQRIVLGDWHQHCHYAVIAADGHMTLKQCRLDQ